MTLAFYVDPAFSSSAGIERYTRELLHALRDGDWARDSVLVTSDVPATSRLLERIGGLEAPIVEIRTPPRLLRYTWSFLGVPAVDELVRRRTGRRVTVVHNPANLRTPTRACPQVVTIHDMFMFKAPSLLTLRQRLVLSRELETRAVRKSAHLITPSESTKRDLHELFDLPAARVSVVPHGVDHAVFHRREDPHRLASLRARLNLPERFVLYVGSLYSRKIGRLLEAYQQVAKRLSAGDCKLVLVGGRESIAAGEPSIAERLHRLGIEDHVVRAGVLSDDDVAHLMSGASAFAYVSLYEGFGFSPLEAMSCGCPVVASDTTSLPEIVGDAGLLVDPTDVEAIASGILRLLEDASYGRALGARAQARAASFTWSRAAQATFDVYRAVGDA
jgi:glycosyltransferase involved in cell wall biosynthesis